MKKLAAASVLALTIPLFVSLVASPASAQPYPPRNPRCGVSDTTLSPGDQVTVSGQHWRPGSTVTFTLRPEGIRLGSTTVNQQGSFSAVVTIPTTVQPGPHRIVCTGVDPGGDPVVLGVDIQILGIVGVGGSAFTGSILNVPLWILLIAALVVLGMAFVILGRRRRRSVGAGS